MQNDGSKLISGAAKPDLETWSIEEESAWTTKYEGMMGQFHIVIQSGLNIFAGTVSR